NARTLAAVAAAVVLTGALALTLWIKGTPSGAANEEALRVTSLAPREGELAASKAASASGAARQPPAAPAVEPPALAAQQPTAAAGSTVLVTLRTLPVGARASIDGFGEVCSTTPCSFPVPRARSLTLRAQSGQLAATRSLELDENAELDLVLAPSAAKRKPRSDGARAVSASHDLKTPAAFR
ncbi:MAG TPA: hypothetical protein VHM19_17680, partial [Polyangiales bacterium]|nr:hypothetical protein [Polyangiales bacterium]